MKRKDENLAKWDPVGPKYDGKVPFWYIADFAMSETV